MRSWVQDKSGVSAVVATVLIIMITIATVVLIWVLIAPFLSNEISYKRACLKAEVSISLDESSIYTCTSSANGTAVRVGRGGDTQQWNAVQIIYTDINGNSESVNYANPPSPNSEKVYRNINLTNIASVSISPILFDGSDDLFCSKTNIIAKVKGCIPAVQEGLHETSKIYVPGSGSGTVVSCEVGGDGTILSPFILCSCEGVQNMSNNLAANYILGDDVDCGIVPYNVGVGFDPIGNSTNVFSGVLNGDGYQINDLFINNSGESYQGLFARISSAEVFNLTLNNIFVNGQDFVGGLAGYSGWYTDLKFISIVGGNISGADKVGGITGSGNYLTINDSYTNLTVFGGRVSYYSRQVGGMVGELASNGSIFNSYSAGVVNMMLNRSQEFTGGLVGILTQNSIVKDSYSVAKVYCLNCSEVGGLIGHFSGVSEPISVISSYWYDNVDDNVSSCSGPNPSEIPLINECLEINGTNGGIEYFYNSSNAPMGVWDFINIWQESSDSYPILK